VLSPSWQTSPDVPVPSDAAGPGGTDSHFQYCLTARAASQKESRLLSVWGGGRKAVYSGLRRNYKRQSGLAGETAELLHKRLPDIGGRRRCQEGVYRNFLNSTVLVKP
jgi:hypothetical protein